MNIYRATVLKLKRAYLQLPLRKKLVLAIVGASFSILLLSIFASFFIEFNAFRGQLLNEYRAIAKMLASNLEAAVVFEDERDSLDVLSVLEQREYIERAVVYLENGQRLADYGRPSSEGNTELPTFNAESSIGKGSIVVNEPIVVDDRVRGKVVLLANLDEVDRYLLSRGLVSLFLIVVTFTIAIFLANRLGNVLSRPILQLAQTAQRIAREKDFSTRQEKYSDDETGVLVDAFNEMISEIGKQNEAVHSNEARFRGYFESGIVGAGILDTKLIWREANVKMMEMLGRDESELLGQTLRDVIVDPFPGIDPEELGPMVEQGYTQDCWVQESKGLRKYIRISLRCISGTMSHAEHVLILASDITDRKLHEEEILKEKEQVEKLSKAKDEFLSVISHELRTPLNPIIGYVEMLKLKSGGKELNQLNLVHDSAIHLLGLINDVLDFSRMDRGSETLNLEWLDYRELCSGLVVLLEPGAKSKGVSLSYVDEGNDFDPKAPIFVKVDRKRIRQVLFNLAGNSVKFTPKGSVEIKSRLSMKGSDRGILRIAVEDTGIGIDSLKRDVIFDPFSQVDTSLSREHDGLGLGLAISRKIALAMDGDIDFRSELGVGSCFWLEIPVEVSAKDLREPVKREYSKGSVTAKGKVLLAEDEPVNREMALSMLRDFGQEVYWAADGQEALEMAEKNDFDLIIMDVMMPRLNGLEAVKSIRNLGGTRATVPIIAVTAHVVRDNDNVYASLGFNEYLSKPYTMNKLADCLNRWIKG